MIRRQRLSRRSGAAAVEAAVALNLVIIPVMIGVWELGRVVYVQQLVAAAAREGARLAAQGQTINQTGNPTLVLTEITPSSNTTQQPNVRAAVYQSLYAAGLTNLQWADVTVTFQFITDMSPLPAPASTAQQPAPVGGQPWQGIKGQPFTVYVSVPYSKVQWTVLGLVKPASVDYTVQWRMMVDDTFSVNTNLPAW